MKGLLIDDFQRYFIYEAAAGTDAGEWTESRQLERLREYLDGAVIIPLAVEKYEQALRSFSLFYDPDSKVASKPPEVLGLPVGICRELFVLQHLAFREDITKDTSASRRWIYHYDLAKNRRMLETLRVDSANPYRHLLVEWAERQRPVRAASQRWEVTEQTLRRTRGILRSLGFSSKVVGLGELYRDFYTVYQTLDVFGGDTQ